MTKEEKKKQVITVKEEKKVTLENVFTSGHHPVKDGEVTQATPKKPIYRYRDEKGQWLYSLTRLKGEK